MEKAFLKIARVALLCITALALVVTALTALYGAFEFRPATAVQPPKVAIKLADLTTPKAEQAGTASEPENKEEATSKACQDVTSKLNSLNKQIGWEKRQDSSWNSATMQIENKVVFDTSTEVDAAKLCKGTKKIVEEQNEKLQPYIKKIDLKDAYYSNLGSFFDEMAQDAQRVEALDPGSDSRYTVSSAFEWYNDKFSSAVDEARDKAEMKQADHVAAKVRGAAGLYAAAISFGFFFSCCLILVFMRIESNMRDLVAETKAQKAH
jgi:hypothetical protein